MGAVREVTFDMGNSFSIEMKLLNMRSGILVKKARRRKHASIARKAAAIAKLREVLESKLRTHPFKRRANRRH